MAFKGHIPWNKGLIGVQKSWNKGKHKPLIERLLNKTQINLKTECFEWQGSQTVHIRFNDKWVKVTAAKAMWFFVTGCLPKGYNMPLCHHCDNPPCINISHLFVGTAFDNMHDRDLKGRHRNQHLVKTLGYVK